MMLSVILCYMLKIRLSLARVGLEVASEIKSDLQDTWNGAGSGLFMSMLEKLNLFYLVILITIMLLM